MDDLIAIRRHLHAHPELSGEEHATTAFLLNTLTHAGLDPRVFVMGTGLWCDITSPRPGPTVALRGDIDGLAMDDEKDVPYRSTVPGVAHSCGHDVHTTIVVGAGLALARRLQAGDLPGRVRLILQPAEEQLPGGALGVIAEGTLDGVDAIFGLHCDPKLEVGRVGVRAGALTAAADFVSITLSGPGGHTARPELTVDMVAVASRVATAVPRLVKEHDLLLVFGSLHAGHAANVIPTKATLVGSLRTHSRDAWDTAASALESALEEVIGETGAEWSMDHVRGVPPVVNDPAATQVLASAAATELGPDAVTESPQSYGGDDFAWYLDHVPGSYARLGVRLADHAPYDLHVGDFDVDEASIGIGARVLEATAASFLTGGSPG